MFHISRELEIPNLSRCLTSALVGGDAHIAPWNYRHPYNFEADEQIIVLYGRYFIITIVFLQKCDILEIEFVQGGQYYDEMEQIPGIFAAFGNAAFTLARNCC